MSRNAEARIFQFIHHRPGSSFSLSGGERRGSGVFVNCLPKSPRRWVTRAGADYAEVREKLGGTGASDAVAEAMIVELKDR